MRENSTKLTQEDFGTVFLSPSTCCFFLELDDKFEEPEVEEREDELDEEEDALDDDWVFLAFCFFLLLYRQSEKTELYTNARLSIQNTERNKQR